MSPAVYAAHAHPSFGEAVPLRVVPGNVDHTYALGGPSLDREATLLQDDTDPVDDDTGGVNGTVICGRADDHFGGRGDGDQAGVGRGPPLRVTAAAGPTQAAAHVVLAPTAHPAVVTSTDAPAHRLSRRVASKPETSHDSWTESSNLMFGEADVAELERRSLTDYAATTGERATLSGPSEPQAPATTPLTFVSSTDRHAASSASLRDAEVSFATQMAGNELHAPDAPDTDSLHAPRTSGNDTMSSAPPVQKC